MMQTSKRRPDNISLPVFDSLSSSGSLETGTVPKFVIYCEIFGTRAVNLRGSTRIAVVSYMR